MGPAKQRVFDCVLIELELSDRSGIEAHEAEVEAAKKTMAVYHCS